jgi:hypothetical protein
MLIQTEDQPFKYGNPIDQCEAFRHVLCWRIQAGACTGCKEYGCVYQFVFIIGIVQILHPFLYYFVSFEDVNDRIN